MTGLQRTYSVLDKYKYHIVGSFTVVVVLLLGISWYSDYRVSQQKELAKVFFEAVKYFEAPVGENATPVEGLPTFKTDDQKFSRLSEEMDAFLKEHSSEDIADTARLVKATAKMELGDFEAAYEELKAFTENVPDSSLAPIIYENLGYACVQLGRVEEAVGYFEMMKAASTDSYVSAMALVHLGDLHHPGGRSVSSDKDVGKARKYYEEALELLPKDSEGEVSDLVIERARERIKHRLSLLDLG